MKVNMFLDLTKAFNTVDHSILCTNIKYYFFVLAMCVCVHVYFWCCIYSCVCILHFVHRAPLKISIWSGPSVTITMQLCAVFAV